MKKFLLSFLCFLLAVAGGYAEEVTYKVASTSSVSVSGTAPAGSSAIYTSTYSDKCQLTKGHSMTLTLSGFAGNKITGLKMSMKSNTSKGAGNFSAKVGDTVISEIAIANFNASSWAGKWSTSYIDVTPKMNVTDRVVNDGEKIVIKIAATVNSLYCQSFTIMYEPVGGGSVTPVPNAPTLTTSCSFGNEMFVEITNISEGSTVYYTTDKSTPSASNGTVYTEPFKITETTTVKAIAVNEAGVSSNVVEATYTMVDPNAKTGTISFANTSQRVSQTTSQQVWSNEGITLTNNKTSSSSNVVGDVKPVKLYAHSEVVLECSAGNMTQILFDCNSSDYATALKNSIGDAATVTVSDDKVTVILDGTSNSFTISDLTAQVRLDALTVTYSAGATKPVKPTLTAGGNFVGSMEVEISCATDGVEIYYTTDGNDPTKESKSYNVPFEITETTTVKAIAFNEAGESSVATAVYTRVAAEPTISFTESTFEESVVVTITAAEGTSAYYTLNGKTPKEDSDECPETLTLRADATLQVIAYDEDGYASPIVKQTFTKKANDTSGTAGTATLVTDAADLAVGDKVVIVGSEGDKNYALSTNQKTNNRAAVVVEKSGSSVNLNDDVQILTLKSGLDNVGFSFYTGTGYLYAAADDANHLRTSNTQTDKGSFTIEIANEGVATIKAVNTDVRGLLRFNYDNGNPLFSCYSSGQSDVSLYKVNLATVEDYVLNVSAAGWSTLYLGYNVVIPQNVTCYVIDEVGEGSVSLKEVTGVLPANTAVIVNAAEGEYTFEVTDATATIESKMEGTTKNEYIAEEAYVLGRVDGKVGLYKAEMMGGVFLNNANKAYLPGTAVQSNAKALKFNFDTTGVEGVKVETEGKKVIYDLSGRRVNEMTQPGIYIVNGKKVMVK